MITSLALHRSPRRPLLVAYFCVPVCDGVSQWAVIQLPIRGELADFMRTSKAISDAAEQYMEDTRQAKTNRIRSDAATVGCDTISCRKISSISRRSSTNSGAKRFITCFSGNGGTTTPGLDSIRSLRSPAKSEKRCRAT